MRIKLFIILALAFLQIDVLAVKGDRGGLSLPTPAVDYLFKACSLAETAIEFQAALDAVLFRSSIDSLIMIATSVQLESESESIIVPTKLGFLESKSKLEKIITKSKETETALLVVVELLEKSERLSSEVEAISRSIESLDGKTEELSSEVARANAAVKAALEKAVYSRGVIEEQIESYKKIVSFAQETLEKIESYVPEVKAGGAGGYAGISGVACSAGSFVYGMGPRQVVNGLYWTMYGDSKKTTAEDVQAKEKA